MTEADYHKILAWMRALCSVQPPVQTLTVLILFSLYPDRVMTLTEIARCYKGHRNTLRFHIYRLRKRGVVRCEMKDVQGKSVGFYSLSKSGVLCVELWEKKMKSFFDASARTNS